MSITSGLNILEMAASAYSIISMILELAVQLTGYDALWCRATPEPNSEDVILQEYTLTNIGVECPKAIKILTTNNDYNPGNFTVDLFGINYDAPLEVHVTISDWNDIFGSDSMPQEGDVVYIKILHKIFEVKTSNIIYSIASMPTYYKCQLTKYNPTASRKETEQFRQSIEEMTVTLADLFGEAISEEVADAVVEVETAYNTTSVVDPVKDFDISSIIQEPLIGTHGTEISHAYYSMSNANCPVTYNTPAHYDIESERKHWIFTNWFRVSNDSTGNNVTVRKVDLYMKQKSAWYFRIITTLKLHEGDIVTLQRGKLINLQGEVVTVPNETNLYVKFSTSEVNKANKKLTNWYQSGTFKITKEKTLKIFYTDNDEMSVTVNTTSSIVTLKFGKYTKSFEFDKKADFSKWTYMAVDFSENNVRLVIELIESDGNGVTVFRNICDKEQKTLVSCDNFEFNNAYIPNNINLDIRNIRLYENEYSMDDTYKMDMLSEITKNASKLILVDAPNVPEGGMFYSPVR